MKLNNPEKRWLEINFYLLCKKIYLNREQYSDLEEFFKAFRWTNLYDYDIIIKTINNLNILHDPYVRPSQYEFLLHLDYKHCRFKYTPEALKQLAKPSKYRYSKTQIYRVRMREEILKEKTTLLPKFNIKDFHEAYYSFLLTLQYFGKLYGSQIKL